MVNMVKIIILERQEDANGEKWMEVPVRKIKLPHLVRSEEIRLSLSRHTILVVISHFYCFALTFLFSPSLAALPSAIYNFPKTNEIRQP